MPHIGNTKWAEESKFRVASCTLKLLWKKELRDTKSVKVCSRSHAFLNQVIMFLPCSYVNPSCILSALFPAVVLCMSPHITTKLQLSISISCLKTSIELSRFLGQRKLLYSTFTKLLMQQRSGPELVYIGNVAIQIISNNNNNNKNSTNTTSIIQLQ